jgi:hypothetical protein
MESMAYSSLDWNLRGIMYLPIQVEFFASRFIWDGGRCGARNEVEQRRGVRRQDDRFPLQLAKHSTRSAMQNQAAVGSYALFIRLKAWPESFPRSTPAGRCILFDIHL